MRAEMIEVVVREILAEAQIPQGQWAAFMQERALMVEYEGYNLRNLEILLLRDTTSLKRSSTSCRKKS